jgi:predicted nucleic acid-binding protein
MMPAFDTNILLPAVDEQNAAPESAITFLGSLQHRDDVAVSESILLELYGLLRNPAVLTKPLSAPRAAEICEAFRAHPRWQLIGFPSESRPLHDKLRLRLREKNVARRRAYDLRTAFALIRNGVTDFATVNVKDFQAAGFRRVWNPLG